jgi:hypothetical protein
MKQILFFAFIVFSFNYSFSQLELRYNPFIKCSIVLKNNDTLNGYVRLNDSPFDIRIMDSLEQRKSKKVDFKTVEKIINRSSNKLREFYYKHTNLNKFHSFVELIHLDVINIYIKPVGCN